jgi:hypothetical protein
MPRLSPKERWEMIKRGEDPDKPVTPPKAVKVRPVRTEADYRKPGEPCSHPPHMVEWDESPGIGKFRICLACGRIVNDPDLKL